MLKFTTAALLLSSSYASASSSVEQMGVVYGDSQQEMVVTFASFSPWMRVRSALTDSMPLT